MAQPPVGARNNLGIIQPLAGSRQRSRSTVYERDNQVLAYGWESLTRGDVDRINLLVDGVIQSRPHCSLVDTEAAFAIAACLYTGRTLDDLAAMSIRCISHWPAPAIAASLANGLFRVASHWGWWLPAGSPGDQQYPCAEAETQCVNRSENLWLPTTLSVIALADLSLRRRGVRLPVPETPMFATPIPTLRTAMKRILRRDRSVRRAGTTIEAVERWLTGALRLIPGGDAAVARVVTARADLQSRTTSYYTSVTQTDLEAAWSTTIAPISPISIRSAPSTALRPQAYGTKYCPKEAELELLRNKLVADITNAGSAIEHHRAQTLYTVVLLTLGVALRPTYQSALASRCFDQASGFGVIDDKRQDDGFTARLAWFPPALRSQIEIYDAMLAKLAPQIAAIHAIRNSRSPPDGYGFFTYDTRGKLFKTSVRAEINSLKNLHDCHFVPNFGRHFMRTRLVGHCSSETLHAFMGHWLRGTEPWGTESGFDPLLYRQDLMQSLVPILTERGWIPVSALP